MTMDISDTLAPNSDQLDAVDLLGGPRTFTITKVTRGKADQPVDVHLADFPRVWRPGKSMRRVLASCWGTDASVWVGRRVTLYCDGAVEFGGKAVGGTRISALSHIDKPKRIPLLVTRGRSAMFTVQPLTSNSDSAAVTAITEPSGEFVVDPIPGDVSKAQLTIIHTLFTEQGITDRAERLAYVKDIIGRDIGSSKELTKAEASRLIEHMTGDES